MIDVSERGRAILRLAAAALGGAFVAWSFQPVGLWWLSWVGVAVLFVALLGRPSWRITVGTAVLWGFTTAMIALPWISEFVGAMPYVALSVTLGLMQIPGILLARFILGADLPWPPPSDRVGPPGSRDGFPNPDPPYNTKQPTTMKSFPTYG